MEFRACTNFVPELQEDFQVAYRKGFRWLHASGTTIGSYKMALERTPLSVRFIRAEATFLSISAVTCFRWHKANGELRMFGGASSCQLLPPPGQAGRKATQSTYPQNKKLCSKAQVNTEFLTPQANTFRLIVTCKSEHIAVFESKDVGIPLVSSDRKPVA